MAPIRRLWQYLIRQKPVQKVFIKNIFGRHSKPSRGIPESQSYMSRLSVEAAAAAAAASGTGVDDGSIAAGEYVHTQVARMHQPVKIIHKDHDAVTAFCINKVSSAAATRTEMFQYLIVGNLVSHLFIIHCPHSTLFTITRILVCHLHSLPLPQYHTHSQQMKMGSDFDVSPLA